MTAAGRMGRGAGNPACCDYPADRGGDAECPASGLEHGGDAGRRQLGRAIGSPSSDAVAPRVVAGPQVEPAMAHIGIGKRKSHYVWIVVGALALVGIAYLWAGVF